MIPQLNLSKDQILKSNYSNLFGNDEVAAKGVYKRLINKWHPDRDGGSEEVFIFIDTLYKNKAISNDYIEISGKKYYYETFVKNSLFSAYYFDNLQTIVLNFNHKHEILGKNYSAIYHDKLFPAIKNKKLEQNYLNLKTAKLLSNSQWFKINCKDMLPLHILRKYIVDNKDWKISAYIISRIFDYAMLFNFAGLRFIGTDPSLLFVDTKFHTIVDISSLFLSTEIDSNMFALSSFQVPSVNKKDMLDKKCSENSVCYMIKSLMLYLAGDDKMTGNVNLIDKDKAHISMIKAINGLTTASIAEMYKQWIDETVIEIFGERKFYKKVVTFNDVKHYL